VGSNRQHIASRNIEEGVIDNSFQAPREPAAPPSQLDVVQAVSDGFGGVMRNLLPLGAAAVAGLFVYIVSICSCLGWIPALPLLFYGGLAMILQAQQGHTRFATLWSGTRDFIPTFFSMWGLILVYFLLLLPTIGLSMGLTLAFDPMTANWVNIPVGALYSLLLVRFQLAPFLLIDRQTGVIEAFSRSWSVTGPVWGKMIALQLLSFLLMSPVQVMGFGMQMLNQGKPPPVDPEEILAQMYPMLALYLGVIVVSLVAGSLVWSFFAAAYRQLLGIQTVQVERA
jgi:hypothetical protein